MIAARRFGTAIGNVVAPHNIIAGSATVGLTGREGGVLRQTVLRGFVYTLLGSGLVSFLAGLGWGNKRYGWR